MGWINEDAPDHEGWVAKLFADGERGTFTSGLGVGVWPGGDIKHEEIRPYADVVAWQVQCDCGWKGIRRPLSDERSEDIDDRWNEPSEDRENALMDEWRAHIAPELRTSRVGELADQIAAMQRDLDDAVRSSRAAGASWADLGRALGVTRQAAQQRYGDH